MQEPGQKGNYACVKEYRGAKKPRLLNELNQYKHQQCCHNNGYVHIAIYAFLMGDENRIIQLLLPPIVRFSLH